MSPRLHYPDFTNVNKDKDALIPQPLEFDFTDPDKSKDARESACKSAEDRLTLFERLTGSVTGGSNVLPNGAQ